MNGRREKENVWKNLKRTMMLGVIFTLFFTLYVQAALSQEQVLIEREMQVVDTFNGVPSYYTPANNSDGDTTYSCAAFVKRYYKQIYGIDVYNLLSGCVPQTNSGSFSVASVPEPGDIGYTPGHWFILKEINSDGTYTIIEQNWKWSSNGKVYTYRNRHVSRASVTVYHWSGKAGIVKLDKNTTALWEKEKTTLYASTENVTTETMKWYSSDAGVASVSNGVITANKAGTAAITVSLTNASGKEVSKAVCRVTVKKPTITLNASEVKVYGTDTVQLTAVVNGPNQAVVWSCDSLYNSVNQNGLVKMGSLESTRDVTSTVKATANGVSATCRVTRSSKILKFATTKTTMVVEMRRYNAPQTAGIKSESIRYSSSNSKIASVDSRGNVTAKKAGKAVITAKADGKSASYTVTVKPLVKLNAAAKTLNTASSFTLKATVKGISGKVKWKSSKTSVASVSASGTVKAKAAGKTTITASIGGTSASCTITVIKLSVKIAPTSATLKAGTTKTLKATVRGASKKVTWSSSNSKIASVNSSGKVTAKKEGKVTITAKANGKKATCKITVKPTLTLTPAKLTLTKNKSSQIKAVLKGTSKKIVWKSSNKSIAAVDSKGKVTGKKKGTATITATAGKLKATCKVTVKNTDYRAFYKEKLEEGSERDNIYWPYEYFYLLELEAEYPHLIAFYKYYYTEAVDTYGTYNLSNGECQSIFSVFSGKFTIRDGYSRNMVKNMYSGSILYNRKYKCLVYEESQEYGQEYDLYKCVNTGTIPIQRLWKRLCYSKGYGSYSLEEYNSSTGEYTEKKISLTEYQRLVDTYCKSSDVTRIYAVKNTAANRDKYFG